jgi:hypothetical protein
MFVLLNACLSQKFVLKNVLIFHNFSVLKKIFSGGRPEVGNVNIFEKQDGCLGILMHFGIIRPTLKL